MSAWVRINTGFRVTPTGCALSADAFTLYAYSAGYASQWGLRTIPDVTRLALGRKARTAVRELIAAGLWEQVETEVGIEYRVRGEGKHWKRCAPIGRRRRSISEDVRIAIYRRDGFRCVTCGREDMLSIDHIFPHSRGGSDEPDNLQTLCRPCNSRKGAKV